MFAYRMKLSLFHVFNQTSKNKQTTTRTTSKEEEREAMYDDDERRVVLVVLGLHVFFFVNEMKFFMFF
jgi:hypothetical protein